MTGVQTCALPIPHRAGHHRQPGDDEAREITSTVGPESITHKPTTEARRLTLVSEKNPFSGMPLETADENLRKQVRELRQHPLFGQEIPRDVSTSADHAF